MRHIDDAERRARLAVRHGLHPDHRLAGAVATTRAMTVLHATEAATVHLAVHARTERVSPADVDCALYQDRSLVKQLAMRRTLFVFPRELLPAALGSASARVAETQRRRIEQDVEKHGVADDGATWLNRAGRAVIAHLAANGPASAREIREAVPEVTGTMTHSAGKAYGGTVQIAPRVLTWLAAQGQLVRGPNAGHWRVNRPTWTLMADWLGEQPGPLSAEEGYAELVRRWLATFGPGTLEDVQWWLGSTKTAVRAAFDAVGAVQVGLDGGNTGWVLPEDVDPVPAPEPWAALLPTLDPTTMGWRGRGFYLDPADVPYLFDTNGNAGNTAWWDGRVVGTWVQDDDGEVRVVLRRTVARGARAALAAEAARLTEWLDGVVITNVYSSEAMKQARLP